MAKKGRRSAGSNKRSNKNRKSTNSKSKGRRRKFGNRPRGDQRDSHKSSHRKTKDRFLKAERTVLGTIEKNSRGFAFLILDDPKVADKFIPPARARKFFHNDRVKVSLSAIDSLVDIEVVEHQIHEIVAQYWDIPSKNKGRFGYVQFEKRNVREKIPCPNVNWSIQKLLSGDWVRVKLSFDEELEGEVTGEIVEVFGKERTAATDIAAVAGEFNLEEHHTARAKREASSFTKDTISEAKGRKDLRNLGFITIDGEDARDFDDAVFVEKNNNGFNLWVAIADVAEYVTKGSQLDQEAYSRGTSVYFPERAFHMLPGELSENLCSLKPNEDRLALAIKIGFTPNGKPKKPTLYEAIIRSQRRATYKEIEAEKNEERHAVLFELYRVLRKVRIERGSIDFDLPEPIIKLKPDAEPESIEIAPRLDSHRLIEEFMIAANEAVARWGVHHKIPFLYRIHPDPDPDSFERFLDLAQKIGAKLPKKIGAKISPKTVMAILNSIKNHRSEHLLNMMLLRSLKQAVYSAECDVHFGLASTAYTHFTSPIRRYPDLIVHRVIKSQLHKHHKTKPPHSLKDMEAIAGQCSHRERLANDASREMNKIKSVRLMMQNLGEELEGKVNGLIEKGFFVQIKSPYCEGFVAIDTIGDDFYEFDEDRMVIFGKRSRKRFQIGDSIKIVVVRADLHNRTVDFELVDTQANT